MKGQIQSMSDNNQYYVGIDFGTSQLKASTLTNGKVRYVNVSKDAVRPWERNVITRKKKKDGSFGYMVGKSAIEEHALHPDTKLIYNVKSMLEHETYDVTFEDGFTTTAKALSAEVFRFLNDRITTQRANIQPIGTVVTVPVCYSEVQKNRIRESAELGGIKVSEVISEPVASVFAFNEYLEFLADREPRLVFVLDFGGGTIDGALIELKYNSNSSTSEVTVLASNGINYGGSDITKSIWETLIKPKVSQEDLQSLTSISREWIAILEQVETIKINLFADDEEEELFTHTCPNGHDISVTISQTDMEKIFEEANLRKRLLTMLDKMFYDDADVDVEDVTHVHFIGGGSAIPYFRTILEDYFKDSSNFNGLEEFDEDDAYMYVSAGASKYAKVVNDRDVVFRNRCAFSVVGSNGVQYIRRNSLYGLKTIKRPVVVEPTVDGIMCMKFFQEIDGFDAKVYMGYFPFSNQVWSDSATFFDMEITYDGTIVGEFYDKNNVSLGTCSMIMEGD